MNSNKKSNSKPAAPGKKSRTNQNNNRRGGQPRSNPGISLPGTMSRQMRVGPATNPRFRKREYICNVGTNAVDYRGRKLFLPMRGQQSNGFITTVADLAINAGLGTAFPWLSNVANAFERFVFHTLKFEYVPSTGTTSKGSVSLCPLYNAEDGSHPTSKTDYLNRAGTVRTPTWAPVACAMDPKKLNAAYKSHFTRHKDIDIGQDKKTYDPCELHVVCEAPEVDSESDLGELYVEYDVELQNSKGNVSPQSYYFCTSKTDATNYTISNVLGDTTYIKTAVEGRQARFTINRVGTHRLVMYHRGDTYETISQLKNPETRYEMFHAMQIAGEYYAWVRIMFITVNPTTDGSTPYFTVQLTSPGATYSSTLRFEEANDVEALLFEQEHTLPFSKGVPNLQPSLETKREVVNAQALAPVY